MPDATVAALVSLLVHALAAQQPPAQPPRESFRTGVELVEADVIVTDKQGKPVRGLIREDFEVFEDGKRVEIESFQAVELPEALPMDRTAAPAAVSGAVIHQNLRALEGTIYLIVLDFQTSTAYFNRARKAALALIEQLGPTDQAAMMSTGGQKQYQVEFTTDRSRLVKALERLAVQGQSMEKLPEFIERAAKQLEAIPARRKVMALISEGFNFDPKIAEGPQHWRLWDAARRANLAVYTFDPRFVGSIDGMVEAESVAEWEGMTQADRDSVAGLRIIAANTGGRATVRTNFLAEGAARMVEENRAYYLLRFYSLAPQDGKFHDITVKTRRPDLEVRSRPGFVAAKPTDKKAPPPPPPLATLVGAPIQTHGLDLRVVAVPIPSAARSGSALAIVTEVRGADLAGAPALELAALAVDMHGKVRARDEYSGAVAAASAEGDRWLRIASRLDVPPGRYQLRVAARRTDGNANGSVFVEIEVPKFTGDVSLGGLTVATPGRRGVARADRLGGLHATPVATSDFPGAMPLVAALAVRVSPARSREAVHVLAQLTGPDGVPHDLVNGEREAAPFTGPAGSVIELPLPSLTPGSYRLEIRVRIRSTESSRTLSFTISDR
jgi:VWFA-related protein